ncbi:hypothetical protein [Geoglobus ahangari]
MLLEVAKHEHTGRTMIIVRCPRCGNPGHLTVHKRTISGPKFKIVHKNGRKATCSIGSTAEGYDELREIHERVRGAEK